MRRLLRPFWFVLALVFLAEAWAWDRLGPVVGRILALIPLASIRVRLTAAVMRLPPLATLLVFAIPGLLLLPFKLLALWLLSKGQIIAGAMTFLAAKTLGLGVTAFLFDICKPKLMQVGWFVQFYGWLLRVKDWAARQAAPARLWAGKIKRRLLGEKGHFLTRLARLRRRSWRRI